MYIKKLLLEVDVLKFFAAQLWKQVRTSFSSTQFDPGHVPTSVSSTQFEPGTQFNPAMVRLENKNGHWMYMKDTWILPDVNKTKGQVIRNSLGKVLKVDLGRQGDSKGMNLKPKDTKMLHSGN